MNQPKYHQDNRPITSAAAPAESSKQPAPMRHNPRLVFADPDDFFHDLLMEQQENH